MLLMRVLFCVLGLSFGWFTVSAPAQEAKSNQTGTGKLLLKKMKPSIAVKIDGETAAFDLNEKDEAEFELSAKIHALTLEKEGGKTTRAVVIKTGETITLDVSTLVFTKPGEKEAPALYASRFTKAARQAALKERGGNEATEKAIAQALVWLVKQQKAKEGSWQFDGSSSADTSSATAFALLAFLGSGQGHGDGFYKPNVQAGIKFLKTQIEKNGKIRTCRTLYGQAIVCLALAEAQTFMPDADLKAKTQVCFDYLIQAQGRDGGWRYTPNQDGDTSVVGWVAQAIEAGRQARLKIPVAAVLQMDMYLNKVASSGGGAYGYTDASRPNPTMSFAGIYSRLVAGTIDKHMGINPEALMKLTQTVQPNNCYRNHYVTMLLSRRGGEAWTDWNDRLQKYLLETQETEGKSGSWQGDKFEFGKHCGRLGTTCLNLLALEAYYRHSR
jgi:hypothetical protein